MSVLAVILVAWTWAQSPAVTHLEDAQKAFVAGRLQRSLVLLDAAEKALGLTEEQLVSVHWTRAQCHVAMGNRAAADASFDAVLKLRPLHEPSAVDTPPHVRAPWNARQKRFLAARPAFLGTPRLEAPRIVVPLEPAARTLVGQGRVFTRAPGEPTFTEVPLARGAGDVLVAVVEPAAWKAWDAAGAVEVVVEATHASGAPWARLGTPASPLRLSTRASTPGAARTTTAAPARARATDGPAPAPPASASPSTPWRWGLPALPAALGVSAAVGTVVAVAACGLSAGMFAYAYRELTTRGIDARPDDKQRWSAVYLGGRVSMFTAAAVAGVGVLLALAGLSGAVVAAVVVGATS